MTLFLREKPYGTVSCPLNPPHQTAPIHLNPPHVINPPHIINPHHLQTRLLNSRIPAMSANERKPAGAGFSAQEPAGAAWASSRAGCVSTRSISCCRQ